MKHLRLVLLAALVLAITTLACGIGRRATNEQVEAPPQVTAPSAVQVVPESTEIMGSATEQPMATEAAPTSEPVATPAESSTDQGQEQALDLMTSISDLATLNSYRAAFRFDWTGTKDDQPVEGYMQMNSAFVRQPPAQELHFEGQGFEANSDQGLGKVSFIQVGDKAWFYESDSDSWMQVPAGSMDFAQGLFFKPEDLLSDYDISKAQRSQSPEQVNGVQAYKYTFDEKDFDLTGLTAGEVVKRASGEVYVAVDGDYVVKLAIDADLSYTDPNEVFQQGNIKMTFDISDINQPITIEPPAEAEAQTSGRDDIPMLGDANIDFSSAEFVSYLTASRVKDAAQFYEDEMPKNGWTANETNMVLDDNAILNYNKGGETANVIVSAGENGTSVLITISKE
jgi:hypothetical protein